MARLSDDERHPPARVGLTIGESLPSGGGAAAEKSDLPPCPDNMSIKLGDGQITLAWDPVPEALFYNIYFKTSRGVTKEGKEYGQGVAYLDDGTMVVVDNAKRYVSKHIDVVVTSVLQTTAGRMIFTRLKEEHEREVSIGGR